MNIENEILGLIKVYSQQVEILCKKLLSEINTQQGTNLVNKYDLHLYRKKITINLNLNLRIQNIFFMVWDVLILTKKEF